jgi:hypothetical protein
MCEVRQYPFASLGWKFEYSVERLFLLFLAGRRAVLHVSDESRI